MPDIATDIELMQRSIQGDRLALERLLVRHHAKLIQQIRAQMGARLQGRVTAEDLFQQTCVEILRGIHRFEIRDEESVLGWLSRIARNRVLDAAKAASSRETTWAQQVDGTKMESIDDIFLQLAASLSTASNKLHREEMEAAIRQAVESLEHPSQRLAVALYYLEGKSLAEVAQAMNMTTNAVRAHLHRAKAQLAIALARFRVWNSQDFI